MGFLTRRVLAFVPMWLAVALVSFGIMVLVPGDPLVSILGPDASPGARAQMAAQLHLDRPFAERFGRWALAAVRGDLGESIFLDRPVTEAIAERAPVTLSLGLGALAVAVLLGVPSGVAVALSRRKGLDTLLTLVSMLGLSTPEFLLGLLLMYALSVGLGWFPSGGYVALTENPAQWLRHLVLPSCVLGFINAALVARMTRSTLLEVLGEDYIRVARAKGLKEWVVIVKHALRVAMPPIVTVIGFTGMLVVAGAFVTEMVFSLPGLGNLLVSAVMRRDYPLVQGGMLVVATGVLLLNLLVDLLYAWSDPRIRYS
ncbi:MAG: ABC transporter permease [Limnochordaceae bacterium]|nr:ABC transporter permease [Limnochordaceae bacterium]